MSDLIERDALMADIEGEPLAIDSVKSVLHMIARRAPAVDAVPVVHGHPVFHARTSIVTKYDEKPAMHDANGRCLYRASSKQVTEQVPYCSECGKRIEDISAPICAWCGAKMDTREGAGHDRN